MRAKRDIADFSPNLPKSGVLSFQPSHFKRPDGVRAYCLTANETAKTPQTIAHHHRAAKPETLSKTTVGTGSACSNSSNIVTNLGTTSVISRNTAKVPTLTSRVG